MATVGEALSELKITEWVLRGEPTTEDEFKKMFSKVTGEDENGTAIETSDTSKWGVTWKEVSDKMAEIDKAAPMVELRKQRDVKLAETDFYALSDVTMCLKFFPNDKQIRSVSKRKGLNENSRKEIIKLMSSSKIVCSNCYIKLENDVIDIM